jgi:DNA-binding MarR family transcriptional regulator
MHHINRHSSDLFGQNKILGALLEKGDLTQNQLAEIIDISAPSLSGSLDKLEKKALIKRTGNKDDKRSNIISLTNGGMSLAERFQRHKNQFEDKMFGNLTNEEKEQLANILEKMHANIDPDEHAHFHFPGRHKEK